MVTASATERSNPAPLRVPLTRNSKPAEAVSAQPSALSQDSVTLSAEASELRQEPNEEDPRVLRYRELREEHHQIEPGPFRAVTIDPEFANLSDDTTMAYQDALGQVEDRAQDLFRTMQIVAGERAEVQPFLNEEQSERFDSYLTEETSKSLQPFEDASRELVDQLDDPLQAEVMGDWPRDRQLEFFEDASRYLGYSEAGRERLARFTDGLSGERQDPLAQLAADLRHQTEGEERNQLDTSLGLLVGVDGAARPEGAPERLAQIHDRLNFSTESPFLDALEVADTAFSGLLTESGLGLADTLGSLENGSEQFYHWTSRGQSENKILSTVANVAGGAAAVLDTVDAVDRMHEGDLLGATGSALGAAAFVARRASMPLSAASLAISGYQFLDDRSERAAFREQGLSQSMGDDPLQHVLMAAPLEQMWALNLDQALAPRVALENRLEENFNAAWRTLPEYVLRNHTWDAILPNEHFSVLP